MPTSLLVPDDFVVPAGLRTETFVLEPLGVRHNALDHAAWTSSIEHIRLTPGFDVNVRSWVRADRAELDKPLYEVVSGWLADSWPFANPDYAAR